MTTWSIGREGESPPPVWGENGESSRLMTPLTTPLLETLEKDIGMDAMPSHGEDLPSSTLTTLVETVGMDIHCTNFLAKNAGCQCTWKKSLDVSSLWNHKRMDSICFHVEIIGALEDHGDDLQKDLNWQKSICNLGRVTMLILLVLDGITVNSL